MNDLLPKIGSIVTFLDKRSRKPPDSTGYNQIGIVVAKNRMLIKGGRSIITVNCIKSGNDKCDIYAPVSPLLLEAVVEYFTDNVMSTLVYDRGISALLLKEPSSLFDNPVLMPKFKILSKNEYEKRWDKIESEARPGDLLFTFDSKSTMSKLIARFDNGSWSHVGIYMGSGKLSEAITSGVTIRNISEYKKPYIHVGLYRLRELTDGQARKICGFCIEQTGKPYNYTGVLKLGLKVLFGFKSKIPSPNRLIHMVDVYLVEYA